MRHFSSENWRNRSKISMSEDEFKILKTLKLPLTIAIHYQNLSSGKNKCLAQKLFGLKKRRLFLERSSNYLLSLS